MHHQPAPRGEIPRLVQVRHFRRQAHTPVGVHKGGVARVMPTTMGPPLKRDRARQLWEGSLGPAFKEIQPPSLDRKKGRKREPSDAGLCIISPSMLCSSRALYTSPFTSSRWYSRHASKGSPHSSSPRPAAAPRARASVHWQTDAHPTPKQLVSGIKTSSVPRRSNSRDKNPHFPKWGQQAKKPSRNVDGGRPTISEVPRTQEGPNEAGRKIIVCSSAMSIRLGPRPPEPPDGKPPHPPRHPGP